MGAATFVFMGLSFTKSRSQRLFHYITAAITLIAAIAYFCMGSNLGWTAIQVEFDRSDPKVAGNMRQIFYVRYIDWFLTTPLLLLDLLLTCGMPTPTIFYIILMDEIMVVTGLVGALVKSSYKWGFFTFGSAAFLFVAYSGRLVALVPYAGHANNCSRLGGQSLRSSFGIRCQSHLPHLWNLDYRPVVFVPHRLGRWS
jgi:bacteriorhodopsin